MAICAVCGKPLGDRPRVRLGSVRLVACANCQSWTYLPRPSLRGQVAIHDDADYFDHPYFQNRRKAEAASDRRCHQIFAQIAGGIDVEALRGDRLLDVGCDIGSFLSSAANLYGMTPVGVDVASRAIEVAKTQGIEGYQTTLEDAPEHLKQFSVITAIDLIEHVVQPETLLNQIFARLRPGGVTYLETPNINSVVYKLGEALCAVTQGQPAPLFERLFPSQHIQYFTPDSFAAMAIACGFEIVSLKLRALPFSDLGTSLPIRAALAGLQWLDKPLNSQILLCSLLRKPQ